MMQHQIPHQQQHALPPHHQMQPQHMQQRQQLQQHQQHQHAPVQPQQPQLSYEHGENRGDFVGIRHDRTYRLVVEQQPVRARMCGFGDKDRRPITPPPCIRLIVLDNKTGEEIDPGDVDSTFFVLMVDLWHEDSSRAVNLVRHSSAAPTVSISSSTVASYPPPPERNMYMATAMMPTQWDPTSGRQVAPPAHYPQQGMPQQYNYQPNPSNTGYPSYGAQNGYAPNQQPIPISIPAPTLNQNHTRNLIGMNAVNACRLNDPDGKLGFWFVLQDLSVRTEGNFRLKLSMCDVGTGQGANAVVSNGKCPVLATSFSEPFTVYSAKKFPGVIESTPLSKCFAHQGIKIPIRKDGPKVANQDEFDADEYDNNKLSSKSTPIEEAVIKCVFPYSPPDNPVTADKEEEDPVTDIIAARRDSLVEPLSPTFNAPAASEFDPCDTDPFLSDLKLLTSLWN